MPLYMYQAAYTPESWAAQLKNPQNRVETVGRQACEAVGGKLVGGWYCFGEYDVVFICDVPKNESMSAIALAVAAGGAAKASKTTVLMSGTEGVGAMKKADAVAKTYKPAGLASGCAEITPYQCLKRGGFLPPVCQRGCSCKRYSGGTGGLVGLSRGG